MFFDRPWTQYQQGFGSPTALYWIGLDRLHQLTQGNCQVRFDLQSISGTWHCANYSSFSVGNSSTNYKLTIGGYSGDVGDAMAYSNGRQFSTNDADHDGNPNYNCAGVYGGGFWYHGCAYAQITTSTRSSDFMWGYWSPANTIYYYYSLKVAEVSLLC